ncbi:MAG TPA: hypothetical protein VIL37_21415 [Natronosporangium sp.]
MAVANLAAVGLVAAPSQAQGVSLCSGTAEGFTIAGDLAVPAGASCTLINSTVRGNVVVRDDANLSLEGSTVEGNLTVRANGFVGALDSSVGGVTALREAFGVSVEQSELNRVNVNNSGFFFSDGTSHAQVNSNTGQTVIISGWVTGNVRTTLDLLTDIRDTVVTGTLTVDQAELGSVVCRSEVDGNVTVRGSGDLIQLGDSAPVAGCEFNVLGGRLTLADNTAEIRVSDNVIRGNLNCTGNAITPAGSDNRLRGTATGQCADLAPASVAPAFGGAAEMTTESRIAGITRQIEERSAAAIAEAVEAGPADL